MGGETRSSWMMELSLIAETVAVRTAKQGIVAFGSSLLLLNRWDSANHISFAAADSSLVDQSPPAGTVQASSAAFIFPVDAIAPSPVRSSSYKTIRRIRKKRRAKRVSYGGDSEDGGGDFGRFLLEGGGGDGPFGFGGGNDGGGKGWNYGGGGGNWDESSSSSWSDPAMEFVYEVICWIALSNCVHFAFKRIVRIVTDGEREKLNLTLSSVC